MATVNTAHTNATVEALGALFDGGRVVLYGGDENEIASFVLDTPAFSRTATGRIQARNLPKASPVVLPPGDSLKDAALVSADETFKITGFRIATPGGALPGQTPHLVIDRLPLVNGDTVRLLSLTYTRAQAATRKATAEP